ncbi:hypothetical protein ACN4EG_13730 [Alkalinema pantanalense CENA528]|uniref:hypothetical protein n=1 Tax=Alkalinema pantanalense TaxID=1620705 RepID=UPI003D6E04DA
MNTAFITLDVSVPANPGDLPAAIEMALRHYGEPLRWAITTIVPASDSEVAVSSVTTSTQLPLPSAQAILPAKAMIEAIVTV